MGKIYQLESKLQNLIAAGEVIENIANVVKELVENALDANSTEIDVSLDESGMKRIQVVDNGSGMDEADAKMAFLRHATSKIRTEYDLFHINSLGFRGEALPSIAAVSKVELITSEGNDAGIKVVVEDNVIKSVETVGARKGTSITVSRLFYHTPARFKYLKSTRQELAKIVELISKFALSHPKVAFSLENNEKTLLRTFQTGNIPDVIASIYGIVCAKAMLPFKGSTRDYHVEGYLSKPLETRSTRKDIHLFVNQRPIQDYQIQSTIIEAYGQLLPIKRFPIVTLLIEVDPQLIDVNVHPAKHQVKFSELDSLKALVYQSIKSALKDQSVYETYVVSDPFIKQEQAPFVNEKLTPYEQTSLFEAKSPVPEQTTFPNLDYIGQYRGTYLLFQNEEGLYLMDQHAAAERIRYERYLLNMGNRKSDSYRLLLPITLQVSASEMTLIDEELTDKLLKLGVKIAFVKDGVEVTQIPHWFPRGHESEFAETMIKNLIDNRQAGAKELLNELAILLSCKHSLKANAYVDSENANELLSGLSKCENPFTCPHGRPIFVKLTKNELEKLFKRS
ncbi:MAG: DNA mismatch repair endonuclease MutL [Candidatus Izemoplasmatales bacterium]|jgi:DNA mismatch repair protein MutL